MPQISLQPSRLQDDIRGLIKGEVRCDDVTRQLFSTDASILERRPLGVVWPRNTDDVVACVQYASEKGIPIHPRGAGTGTSGGALGNGLVLDFSRFMRRIVQLGPDSAIVQPGLIRERLNGIVGKMQRRCFGPDPGFVPTTTIGGILARNGAGAHWLRYGFPIDHLLGLTVVLADGEVMNLRRDSFPQAVSVSDRDVFQHGASSNSPHAGNFVKGLSLARKIVLGKKFVVADDVHRILAPLTIDSVPTTASNAPDRCGYQLRNVLLGPNRTEVDLARLIVGSEGTLALITEAHLKTVPQPKRGAAAAFFFNSLEKATGADAAVLPFQPNLCELIDRRRRNNLREWDKRFQAFIPLEAEAILIVELDAGTVDEPSPSKEVRARLGDLVEAVAVKAQLCFQALKIELSEDFRLMDDFLHNAELSLFRMQRSFQPVPLLNHLAVPVDSLSGFVRDLLDLLQRHEITASLSGHVGHGHLRVQPIVDLAQTVLAPTFRRLTEDVCGLVWQYRGTISSEGATGMLLSEFVPQQYSALFPTFQKIKELFDPNRLFNPGKVIPDTKDWTTYLRRGLTHRGSTGAEETDSNLSSWDSLLFSPSSAPIEEPLDEPSPQKIEFPLPSQLELQLKWNPKQISEPTYRCNGCGDCQNLSRSVRMCPFFRRRPEEETSPRAKANLLCGVLDEHLELEMLTRENSKTVADNCFHCLMCRSECPAQVDVSRLAARCKAAFVAAHGLSFTDRLFSRMDSLLPWLSLFSCPVNWSISNPITRWIFDKTLQIPFGRKLPTLAKISFLGRIQWAKKRATVKSTLSAESKVALFIDTFANHCDTKLVDLTVKILEHQGISVYIPLRQRTSGLVSYSVGHADRVERIARHNTLLFADLIRQGYDVVTIEPASAACLTTDYRSVLDDPDSVLLTENVVDCCTYLMLLHRRKSLRLEMQSIRKTVGFHAPCRSIANGSGRLDAATPAEELLRLIPGLNVRRFEEGCCGLAGTFGLKKENYRQSLQIGVGLFKKLRAPEIDFGATDCNSCRMQMEHAVPKPTIHPLRILAYAYGFAPEVAELIS